MSDADTSGFAKFVPGFEFLQNIAKGAGNSLPQMPNLGNWVAPTLNVEELDKRIEELKNVQFWLEQNSRALAATIQALEVQKMTLATLKGMNFNIGDIANAFTQKARSPVDPQPQVTVEKAATARKPASAKRPAAASSGAAAVDPLQLWGALAQQFQAIASGAIKEASAKTAADLTRNVATGIAKEAVKSVKSVGKQVVSRKKPAASAKKTTRA